MNVQPQHVDYSTYSPYWREQIDLMASILRARGVGEALETLRKAAVTLGEWTPELQALRLRILKPDAPWSDLVTA